jgi:hypothetical protein
MNIIEYNQQLNHVIGYLLGAIDGAISSINQDNNDLVLRFLNNGKGFAVEKLGNINKRETTKSDF